MRAVLCGVILLLLGGSADAVAATGPSVGEHLSTDQAFGPPIHASVSRRFDPGAHRYGPGHRGVDLSASVGSPIRAAGGGKVAFAGQVAGRPAVSIVHADGLRTTYEPVTPAVTVGQVVNVGDVIGRLLPGHAGCPAPACLHWGLRLTSAVGETYLDPLLLLGHGRVRLKPLKPSDAFPG
jgi:murein DD-endopeptidase MepM/ murein hydrolase activator NlpD